MTMTIMSVITFFLVYLYNVFLLKSYKGIVKFRFNEMKTSIFFSIILFTWEIFCVSLRISLFNSYLVSFLVYVVIFRMIFDESISTIYVLVIYQIFFIVINLDIVTGVFAFLTKKSIYEIAKNYNDYIVIFVLSKLIMIIILDFFNNGSYKDNFKKLLLYRKKIRGNIFILVSLVIILLRFDYIDYNFNYMRGTIAIMLINRGCIYFCFYFTINMGIESIRWVEEELVYKTNLLNLEYHKDMSKKIDEYSNLLKMYNHDFKSVLNSINDSIELGEIDKAKKIIFEFNEQIQTVIDDNKIFSNNKLINAIFNRLNEQCKSNNIYFEADCYIPDDIKISELELIKIFNNLSSNAYEACIKQKESEKKIIVFKSYVKENYFILYENNSFNGKIKIKNDKFTTTKDDKKLHGIGVESVKHIVNSANGVALIKVDKDKKEFNFLIKISLTS